MKRITRILFVLLFAGFLISFNNAEPKLKDGYYSSSFGHAAILFKIDGNKIEFYLDNVTKSWGQGNYEIVPVDSVIKVNLIKHKTSRKHKYEPGDFNYSIHIVWDSHENLFKLRDYQYVSDMESIRRLKRRVRSSCRISVKKPDL